MAKANKSEYAGHSTVPVAPTYPDPVVSPALDVNPEATAAPAPVAAPVVATPVVVAPTAPVILVAPAPEPVVAPAPSPASEPVPAPKPVAFTASPNDELDELKAMLSMLREEMKRIGVESIAVGPQGIHYRRVVVVEGSLDL
jgi:hypothetical protein